MLTGASETDGHSSLRANSSAWGIQVNAAREIDLPSTIEAFDSATLFPCAAAQSRHLGIRDLCGKGRPRRMLAVIVQCPGPVKQGPQSLMHPSDRR